MKHRISNQAVLGLGVLTLGVGFLLDAMGVINFGEILRTWWPSLVIVLVLFSMLRSGLAVWPLIIVAAAALLQLRNLDAVEFNVWSLIWPAVVIAVGLSLIFKSWRIPARETGKGIIDSFAAFGGSEIKDVSEDFKGGQVSAIFGGSVVDLREAAIKDTATLEVFCFCGGVEIYAPEDWRVETSGAPIFGGWENKTKKPADKKAPVLRVNGTFLFGGMSVRNKPASN